MRIHTSGRAYQGETMSAAAPADAIVFIRLAAARLWQLRLGKRAATHMHLQSPQRGWQTVAETRHCPSLQPLQGIPAGSPAYQQCCMAEAENSMQLLQKLIRLRVSLHAVCMRASMQGQQGSCCFLSGSCCLPRAHKPGELFADAHCIHAAAAVAISLHRQK